MLLAGRHGGPQWHARATSAWAFHAGDPVQAVAEPVHGAHPGAKHIPAWSGGLALRSQVSQRESQARCTSASVLGLLRRAVCMYVGSLMSTDRLARVVLPIQCIELLQEQLYDLQTSSSEDRCDSGLGLRNHAPDMECQPSALQCQPMPNHDQHCRQDCCVVYT